MIFCYGGHGLQVQNVNIYHKVNTTFDSNSVTSRKYLYYSKKYQPRAGWNKLKQDKTC